MMNLDEAIETASALQSGDILDTDEAEAIDVLIAEANSEPDVSGLSLPQKRWLEHEMQKVGATLENIPSWVLRLIVEGQLPPIAIALIWPRWEFNRQTGEVLPCRV